MTNRFIIEKPIITEKAAQLAQLGQYVFRVQKNASSDDIKKMVKKIYNVDVVRVNIVNTKPRLGRYGRIPTVKKAGYKKAIVTLRKGQSIEVVPT